MPNYITNAAPRFMMRFFLTQKKLQKHLKTELNTLDIAEIGAGTGDFAAYLLSKNSKSLTVFEKSIVAKEILESRFSNDNINIYEDIGHKKNMLFDIIFAFEVIEHIQDDRYFISKIIRPHLKENGLLIGSVPAYMDKWQNVDIASGHYRRYEPDQLYTLFTECGFEVIDMTIYGAPITNLLYFLRQKYYKKYISSSLTKEQLTSTSGINREKSNKLIREIIFLIIKIISPLQEIKLLNRHGDGLFFILKKT